MQRKLTPELVSQYLSYDKIRGTLTWKVARGSLIRPGDLAGTCAPTRERRLMFLGVRCAVAQLIWLLETGEWPRGYVCHKNGDNQDDRFHNLYIRGPR